MKKTCCLIFIIIFIFQQKTEAQKIKHFFEKIDRLDSINRAKGAQRKAENERKKMITPTKETPAINEPKKQNEPAEVKETKVKEAPTEIKSVSPKNEASPNSDKGMIILENPKQGFVGSTLLIPGESVYYKNFTTVKVEITNGNYKQNAIIPLSNEGKFTIEWQVPADEGDYVIKATSSDGNKTVEKTISVTALSALDEMASDNLLTIEKVTTKTEKAIDELKKELSSDDANELEKKKAEFKEKIDLLKKLYTEINTANKKISVQAKGGKVLPKNLNSNLSALQNELNTQNENMKRMQEFANHKPTEYTICEYINSAKEVLAAFSTVTNFGAKTITGILKNITIDKGIPLAVNKGVGYANTKMGKTISSGDEFKVAESSKIYATALTDAQSLTTKLGVAGIVGDLLTFLMDVLLKKYCGVFEGTVTHTADFRFFNEYDKNWWKYKNTEEATITLRYPKAKNTGKIIKMKGNIEGNATNFTFGADPKEAIAKELKTTSIIKGQPLYDHVYVIMLGQVKPPTIPFASSKADKASFNFGLGARATATPAYFNVSVDAEYNLDTKEIKLFINEDGMDFTAAVRNRQAYIFMKYIVPEVNYQEYPIEKAYRTMKANLKVDNKFIMEVPPKQSPKFSGVIKRTVNSTGSEIKLEFKIEATQQ